MKRILLIAQLLILSITTMAQPLGSPGSTVNVKGGLQIDSFLLPPTFTDTPTSARLKRQGAMIRVKRSAGDTVLYTRQNNQWVQVTGINTLTFYRSPDSIISYGNSYGLYTNGYSDQVAARVGAPLRHLEVSGRDAIAMVEAAYTGAIPYKRTATDIVLIGTNDTRRCIQDYQLYNMWYKSWEAFFANEFMDTAIGYASTAIAKTGGASVTQFPIGKGSRILNSTKGGILLGTTSDSIIYTFTKPNVVVGYFNNFEYGDFVVILDGVRDTIYCRKACLSTQIYPTITYYSSVKVYQVQGGVSHTLIIKPLSIGGPSLWPLDYIGHMADPSACKPIVISDCPYLPSLAYNMYASTGYGCGNRERVDKVNAITRAIVSNEFSQYPVGFASSNNFVKLDSDFMADLVHPTIPVGAGHIADAYINAFYSTYFNPKFIGSIPYLGDSAQAVTTIQTADTIFPKGNIALTSLGLEIYKQNTDAYFQACLIDSTIRKIDSVKFPSRVGPIVESPAGKFTGTPTGSGTTYMRGDKYIPGNQSGYLQWQVTASNDIMVCLDDDTVNIPWTTAPAARYRAFIDAGKYWYSGAIWDPSGANVNTGINWSANDSIRFNRLNGIVSLIKSSNGGRTWTTVYAGNALYDTIPLYVKTSWTGTSAGAIINPTVGYGYTFTGNKTMEVNAEYYKTGSIPQSPVTGVALFTSNDTLKYIKPSGAIVAVSVVGGAIQPRITTITTSATPTPNLDNTDQYNITALATNTTITNPTGTPVDGQQLVIRITPDATPRTLAFGTAYRFGTTVTAPTITTASKTMYLYFVWNALASKLDCVRTTDGY